MLKAIYKKCGKEQNDMSDIDEIFELLIKTFEPKKKKENKIYIKVETVFRITIGTERYLLSWIQQEVYRRAWS